LTPGLAVLTVDFDDLDTLPSEEAGDAGPIGSRAFDPHLGDVPEASQPGEEGCVAVRVGSERFGAQ
jgi:hypothetical protein